MQVTMVYYGTRLHLDCDRRDDVTVEQQHCGGNSVVVYNGKLRPGGEISDLCIGQFLLEFNFNDLILRALYCVMICVLKNALALCSSVYSTQSVNFCTTLYTYKP